MAEFSVNISVGDAGQEQNQAEALPSSSEPRRPKFKKKKKKLPPSTIPKLFEASRMYWEKNIARHRERMSQMKPVVDDLAPMLQVGPMLEIGTLGGEEARVRNIDKDSIALMKIMNEVNRRGGRTDTFDMRFRNDRMTNLSDRRCAMLSIEKANLHIAKLLERSRTRMYTATEYGEDWKRIETYMSEMAQFPLFWKVKKKEVERIEVGPPVPYFKQYITEKSAKYPDKRPRVYFEISIKTVGVVGRMVAVLFSDYVPKTVKNFLAFCDPNAKLTYKGNRFYLIFQNYFCQTGDVVENMGFGGTSIYGPYFGDEDHTLKHGERGVLTMFNKIPNRNHCQFLVTFRRLNSLDGNNVVFGKIIRGFHVLDAIESVGSKKTGRPKVEIYISDCDEI